MTRLLLSIVALVAVYLLTLTSIAPGDVLVGVLVAAPVAVATRRLRRDEPADASPLHHRLLGVPQLAVRTLGDVVSGSWRVARMCLGPRAPTTGGLVVIDRGDRSAPGVAQWGVLTGLTPDEVVVDIDEERGELIVHVIDARDPEAVRRTHRQRYEQSQRKVFP